jgi:uncharacterized protein (TIGR02300 family)
VTNPAWGTKRVCQACQSKYYDLNSDPAVCPKCQVEFDPAACLKSQPRNSFGGRSRGAFDRATPLGIETVAHSEEKAEKPERGDDEADEVDEDAETDEDAEPDEDEPAEAEDADADR